MHTPGPTRQCLMMTITTSLPSPVNTPPPSNPQTSDLCTRSHSEEGSPLHGPPRASFPHDLFKEHGVSSCTVTSSLRVECARNWRHGILIAPQNGQQTARSSHPCTLTNTHHTVRNLSSQTSWPWLQAFTSRSNCTTLQGKSTATHAARLSSTSSTATGLHNSHTVSRCHQSCTRQKTARSQ